MIKAVLIGACLLCSMPAMANDAKEEMCPSLSSLAETVMTARQKGVPMNKLMGVLSSSQLGQEPTLKDVIRTMVIEAYNRTKFNSTQYQQEAAVEYGNEWNVACWQSKLGEKE